MESWRVFARGWKLALSSFVPAVVQALVTLAVWGFSLAPVVWLIAVHAERISAALLTGEPPLVLLWRFSLYARAEWRAILLWFFLLSVWLFILSIVYLYAEAGILGTLIRRAELKKNDCDFTVWQSGLKRPEAGEVLRALWRGGLANGWKVVKLAGGYVGMAFIPLVALEILGWACGSLAILHPRASLPALLAFFLGLSVVGVLTFLLLIHYGCALVFTVRDGLSVREAARSAGRILRAKARVFAGLLLFRYAVSMAVSSLFNPLLIALLFAFYFLRPPLWLTVSTSGVLMVLWLLVRSLVKISALGCYVAFCEKRPVRVK